MDNQDAPEMGLDHRPNTPNTFSAFAAHTSVYRLAAVLALSSLIGCGDSSPTGPVPFDPPGTHQAALTGVGWSGAGGVSVTPRAAGGVFTADIKVRLRNAKPNTTYIVQRAPEVGRALSSDGVCQRGMSVSPWSSADPPAPAFMTFTQPNSTTPVSMVTSATGDGSVDFPFSASSILAGTQFDVMFRVLDDVALPKSVLLSECVTVLAL
jgi:hypothetical protein